MSVTLNSMSREAFDATVREPVVEVTRVPEAAMDVDIWPYAEAALACHYPDSETDDWDVKRVYVGDDNRFQHVFIETDRRNVFLVVVLSVTDESIVGHHVLDLDASED